MLKKKTELSPTSRKSQNKQRRRFPIRTGDTRNAVFNQTMTNSKNPQRHRRLGTSPRMTRQASEVYSELLQNSKLHTQSLEPDSKGYDKNLGKMRCQSKQGEPRVHRMFKIHHVEVCRRKGRGTNRIRLNQSLRRRRGKLESGRERNGSHRGSDTRRVNGGSTESSTLDYDLDLVEFDYSK